MPRIEGFQRRVGQLSLLPDTPVELRYENVHTSDIAIGGIQAQVEVRDDFLDSVSRMGILQPLVLIAQGNATEDGRPPYVVAAGRRRLRAATILGIPTVPAMIFPAGTSLATARVVALTENLHRHPNAISELESIEDLMGLGYPEERVAELLHVPISRIRTRLRMSPLDPNFRLLVSRGDLSVTLATRIARLSPAEQENLLIYLHEGERVTPRVVTNILGNIFQREQPALAGLEGYVGASSRGQGDAPVVGEDEDGRPTLQYRGVRWMRWDDATLLGGATITQEVHFRVADLQEQGESWDSVMMLLSAAAELLPLAGDEETDRFYASLDALVFQARQLAAGRSVQSATIHF